jgi:hypothetical protein
MSKLSLVVVTHHHISLESGTNTVGRRKVRKNCNTDPKPFMLKIQVLEDTMPCKSVQG